METKTAQKADVDVDRGDIRRILKSESGGRHPHPARRAKTLRRVAVNADVDYGNDILPFVDDPCWYVRQTAIELLGRWRYGKAIRNVVQLLFKETNYDVRLTAQNTLTRLVERDDIIPIIEMIFRKWDIKNGPIGNTLDLSADSQIVDALVRASKLDFWLPSNQAIVLMGEFKGADEAFVPCIVEGTNSHWWVVRKQSVMSLANKANTELAVSTLFKAIKDENSGIRCAAMAALVRIGASPDVVLDAIKVLVKDLTWQVRRSALWQLQGGASLGAAFSPDVIDAVIDGAWDDESPGVRAMSAKVLGAAKVSSALAWKVLTALQDDKNNGVAATAIMALPLAFPDVGKVGGLLIRALDDNGVVVRRAATIAMASEMSGDRGVFVEPLLDALCDTDDRFIVRVFAAKALASIGNKAAVDGLVEYIESESSAKDMGIRRVAVESLLSVRDVDPSLVSKYSRSGEAEGQEDDAADQVGVEDEGFLEDADNV